METGRVQHLIEFNLWKFKQSFMADALSDMFKKIIMIVNIK